MFHHTNSKTAQAPVRTITTPAEKSQGNLIAFPASTHAPDALQLPQRPKLTVIHSSSNESVEPHIPGPVPADAPLTSRAQVSTGVLRPTLFFDALREAMSSLVSPCQALLSRLPFSSAVTGSAVVGLTAALCVHPGATIGAVAVGLIVTSLSFSKNHHTRATNCIGQALFATHVAFLSAWPAVIGSGIASSRMLLQGMIPEEKPHARLAVALAGYSLGAAAMLSFMDVFPLTQLNNLPLGAMTLTTAAEAFTKRYSWATRLCYLAAGTLMIPYHACLSGSLFGVGVNLIAIPSLLCSMWRNDIAPHYRTDPRQA